MQTTVEDKLKSKFNDLIFPFLYALTLLLAYITTVQISQSESVIQNGYLEYTRGAFIFFAPFSIESLKIFTTTKVFEINKRQCGFILFVLLFSIVLFATSMGLITINKTFTIFTNAVISIYPLKYVWQFSTIVVDYYNYIKEQRGKMK